MSALDAALDQTPPPGLPHVHATAYLTPLREGGSLPGLVEADDLGTYVVKFTAAGQGPKALVAEIVVGELGRTLGVDIPDLALIDVDAEPTPVLLLDLLGNVRAP